MKFSKIVFLVLCLCFFQSIQAQQEKPVIIDGVKYIMHQVEKGHTLYAISKKYSISIEALISANPAAANGVKVGDRLRIPLDKMDKSFSHLPSPQIQSDYIIHTVAKKETLYSLARRYDKTTAEILAANPDATVNLQEGQILRIPVSKGSSTVFKAAEDENLSTHQVGINETLYSLSKLYGVSVDDIKAANGGLSQGLLLGMTIRIPKKGEAEKVIEPEVKKPQESIFSTSSTPKTSVNQNSIDKPSFGSYKIVMLLPFETSKLDSLEKLGHHQVALEFYQGAMIAIDSLRQLGMDMDVYIYDSNKDVSRVKELAQRAELAGTDLFIGPMYKSELLALSEIPSVRNTHIVCPVPQSGGILVNRPYISKAHCDDATQISAMTRFIHRRHSQDNVLMIAPTKAGKEKLASVFSAAFNANRNGGLVLKELVSDVPSTAQIEERLMAGKENVIYIASNELAYISSLMNKLLDLQGRYQISLFGNEDWLKFDQIDNSYKNRLNLHLPQSHYVDYQSPVVKDFLLKYRERYGTDPNDYGFLGYDVSMYYLSGLAKNGRGFFQNLSNPGLTLTSLRFKMERPSETVGFNNFGAFIVRYRDYKLEVVN